MRRVDEQIGPTTRSASRSARRRARQRLLGAAARCGVDASPPREAARAQVQERRYGQGLRREYAARREERSTARGIPDRAPLPHRHLFQTMVAVDSTEADATGAAAATYIAAAAAAAEAHDDGRTAAALAAAAIGADGRRSRAETSASRTHEHR